MSPLVTHFVYTVTPIVTPNVTPKPFFTLKTHLYNPIK